MKLTKDQVKKVARLANLPLTSDEEDLPEGEAGKYSEQLSRVLEYIDQLNQVDTTGVEPTFNVSGESNIMREDTTVASLSQEEALSNAPQKKEGMFVTKGVFEE